MLDFGREIHSILFGIKRTYNMLGYTHGSEV